MAKANPSPRFDRQGGKLKDKPATPFHNWYDAMAFLRAPTLLAPERTMQFRSGNWSILPQEKPEAAVKRPAVPVPHPRSAPELQGPPPRLAAGRPD